MAKVSVIIPTFNRAHIICDSIDSILRQTYKDFEIVVVDDGSTDDTEHVLAAYGDKIQYIKVSHVGSSEARNIALRQVDGEYVAFLDSDDLWYPEKLEKQMALIESDSRIGIVHSFSEIIDNQGSTLDKETGERLNFHYSALKRGYHYSAMARQCILWPSTIVVRKACFDEFGLFDPRVEAMEDWDFYLRVALKYEFKIVPEILTQFRFHDSRRSLKEFTEGRVNTCLKHLDLLEQNPGLPFVKKSVENLNLNLVEAYYMVNDLGQCRTYLAKIIKSNLFILFNINILTKFIISSLPRVLVVKLLKNKAPILETIEIRWNSTHEDKESLKYADILSE